MAKALELLTSEHKGTKIVTKRNTVPVLNMAMMLDTDLHQDLWKQVGRKQFSVPWDETYDVLPLEEQQKRDVTVYQTIYERLLGRDFVSEPDEMPCVQCDPEIAHVVCSAFTAAPYGHGLDCTERDLWFSLSYLMHVWYLVQLGCMHPAGFASMQTVIRARDRRKLIAGQTPLRSVRNVYERTFFWDVEQQGSFVYHPGRYEQGIWMPARWEATDGTDLVGQIAKNLSEYNIQQALHRAKRIYL